MPEADLPHEPTSIPAGSIRKAGRADLPGILHMIQELAAHHGDEATVGLAELERDLFAIRPWLTALVADGDSGLMGYAILCPTARVHFGQRGMDVQHLFVKPPFRGTGLGQRLVDAAMDEARAHACSYLAIGTHPDNTRAQKLYVRLGFEPVAPSGTRFRLTLTSQGQAR